jgi:hypothetical protein
MLGMARGHHKQAMYPDLCKDHRRSTMVDVAASIVGILAAAGKVAETLTPIISVLKDVNKHTAIVLAEVNASRTILSQLHTYLHDLDALPGPRKDLIPLHSLVATFTDGTLLFSELEAVVCRLDAVNGIISKRIKTAWKHSDLDSLSVRLQTFKLSITTILGILCWFVRHMFPSW